MKFDAVKNPNYLATVVHLDPATDLRSLEGLDNLAGYNAFGMQALTEKNIAPGLYLMFSTEVQLSLDYAKANNLHRDGLLNADVRKTGYLEDNRRVKAIRLRKHASDSLLMPVSSLSYMLSAKDLAALREGDVFDSIDGKEVCRKYLVKGTPRDGSKPKAKASVRRVHERVFPEHLDSENYFRNAHKIPQDAQVTVSQKLHGTSVRYGHVPAYVDQKWWERLLRRKRRTTHRFVVGSRRLVKSVDLTAEPGKNHYYGGGDLWTRYADEHNLAGLIPKDHVVYGELVGFTNTGESIQKGYTYGLPDCEARLYVYRVAVVTADGVTIDYTTEQMETFCVDRGLSMVPVLWVGPHAEFEAAHWLDRRYYDDWVSLTKEFRRIPCQLSDKGTVDEGVCVRYDGPYGSYIVKAKSPKFFEFETKQLDAGTGDIEAEEAEVEDESMAVA